MLSKLRSLTIFAALGMSLPVTGAQAQSDDLEQPASFPRRLEQLGRSLVGNNRAANQRPPRSAPASRPPSDPYYYDTPVADDEVAPRSGSITSGQQAMRRGPQTTVPQPAPQRRTVDPPRATSTPAPGRALPSSDAAAAPRSDGVPRTARAELPRRDEAEFAAGNPQAPAADAQVVRGSTSSISVETVGPRKISVGKQATYKLILKNTGGMAARDVVVTVAVPEFAEVVEAKGTSGATEPAVGQDGLCWKLSTLVAQGREELSLDIVPHKSQPFDLAVRWTQAPVASQTTVEVQEPKLALTLSGAKEVPFGDRATYKLLLSNPGTGEAENVVITLMPLDPSDGPPASHPLGVMRAGESKTIEIELIARQAGQVTIHAEAKAAGDVFAELNEQVLVRRAALAVTAQGPKMQYADAPANYEIRIKNSGNAPAQNLRVTCRLPRGAEYESCSASGQHGSEENTVQWTVATLEAGAETTLSAKCVLHSPGVNQVEIMCLADGDLQQGATADTQVEAVADLAMTLVDPSGPVAVGKDATYEIHVRNRGSKTAESIDVTAYFSNGVEPVSVEGGAHDLKPGMVVLRTIGSLEMGREMVYKIKARADVPGRHRFRAELNCKPLDTKLTAEETTLFYGEPAAAQ